MKTKQIEKCQIADSEATKGEHVFSLISNEKLLSLYAGMLNLRNINELKKESGAENAAVCNGWEASILGVAIDLQAEDAVLSWNGHPAVRRVGQSKPEAIFDPHPATAADPQADADAFNLLLGKALYFKTQKNGRISVVFTSGAILNRQGWNEALEVAGAYDLPVIFFHLNPQDESPANGKGHSKETAPSDAVPCIPVDGSDAVAVYRVAFESISRARLGRGATLIECRAFGLADEISPKSAQSRSLQGKHPADSLQNMKVYLERKGLLSQE